MRRRTSPTRSVFSVECRPASNSSRSPRRVLKQAPPRLHTNPQRPQSPAQRQRSALRAVAARRWAMAAVLCAACSGRIGAQCNDSTPPCPPRSTWCRIPHGACAAIRRGRAHPCNSRRPWSSIQGTKRPASSAPRSRSRVRTVSVPCCVPCSSGSHLPRRCSGNFSSARNQPVTRQHNQHGKREEQRAHDGMNHG